MTARNGVARKVRKVADEARGMPVVVVDKLPQEAPLDDVVYLEADDCAVVAEAAANTREFQLYIGGLLKGQGRDRSVKRNLVVLQAALVPEAAGSQGGSQQP